MTIDERLEKLTERHEALAQSVEFISMEVSKLTQQNQHTSRKIEVVVEAIRDLVGVVRSHEQQIFRLENPN